MMELEKSTCARVEGMSKVGEMLDEGYSIEDIKWIANMLLMLASTEEEQEFAEGMEYHAQTHWLHTIFWRDTRVCDLINNWRRR